MEPTTPGGVITLRFTANVYFILHWSLTIYEESPSRQEEKMTT